MKSNDKIQFIERLLFNSEVTRLVYAYQESATDTDLINLCNYLKNNQNLEWYSYLNHISIKTLTDIQNSSLNNKTLNEYIMNRLI